MKNNIILIVIALCIAGCAHKKPEVRLYIQEDSEINSIAKNYLKVMLNTIPQSKFRKVTIRKGFQYETISVGDDGLEYATQYDKYIIPGRRGKKSYVTTFDHLTVHFNEFNSYLGNTPDGIKLYSYYKNLGIADSKEIFFSVFLPALGKIYREETVNIERMSESWIYRKNSEKYPTAIKCPTGDNNIWPKFYLAGKNNQGQLIRFWVGFCEDEPILAYDYFRGWFKPDELLSKTIQEYKNFQGNGKILNKTITNLPRRH